MGLHPGTWKTDAMLKNCRHQSARLKLHVVLEAHRD